MKSILRRYVSLICLLCAAGQAGALKSKPAAESLRPASEAARARVNEAYGRLPLSFEVNRGQANASVKFLSMGDNYSILLSPNEVALNLSGAKFEGRLKFTGANPSPLIEGLDQLPGKSNYLIGADRSKWRTNIPNYARVRYNGVWPGIDVVLYGNQRQLEYDFVVAPRADPRTIRLSFEGAKKISVDANGDLILRVADGELRQRGPVVYQEVNGEKRLVSGRYVVKSNQVGFEIGDYDRGRELVIDPVLRNGN